MSMLLPHQERVVEEKKELDAKVEKLGQFMTTPVFITLDGDERARLSRQHIVMTEYSTILGERITAFVL